MESKIKFKPNLSFCLRHQALEVLRHYHYIYKTDHISCVTNVGNVQKCVHGFKLD